MIFKELAVKNYGNIKSAKIDLDYQGLTFIFGKNKDGGPGATNGAGKSQFWTSIPEIGYGSPPTGKDGHKHKNSAIRLKIQTAPDTELSFQKVYNKSGTKKFKVLKNGEDINVRTLDYTEKKLQQYLGKTEEDFYTKVYVDSLKVHPLIVGSASVRQDFFVRMFNLENVDHVRKMLAAELTAIQKVAATYKEVQHLFKEAKAELKTTTEEREVLGQKIKTLRKERDQLLERSTALQTIRDLVSFERDNAKLIERFHKVTTVESFEDDLQALKSKRKALKAKRELAIEWKSYRKQHSKYKAALSEVDDKLKRLLGDEYAGVSSFSSIEKRSARFDDAKAAVKSATARLESIGSVSKPKPVEEPKSERNDCAIKVQSLQNELRHAKEFHDGKCPTCGSSVKAREVEVIKEELSKWKRKLEGHDLYDAYKSELEVFKTNREARREYSTLLDEALRQHNKWKLYSESREVIRELPDKPERPEGEEVDASDVEEKLDKVSARIAVFDSVEPIIERLTELSKLSNEDRAKVKSFDKVNERLTELNKELTRLETFKTQQDEAVRQLEKLKGRGKVLRRQAEDEPVLKALVSAYSTKGLKRLLIQRYAALLQNQVNKFVKFTFSEDFTFEFRFDKRLEVLVHRKYGKKIKTTDVKRLSGAEKRMFTLLLVIATYTLTPKKRRSNLLILDEMEANMGPEAVQNFLKALPILNKIVPHIVVITPKPELHVDGARCFTAVKNRGVTTLVEGRV